MEDEELDAPKSRTQIKHEAHALQELGEELIKLSAKDLSKIPLDDNMVDAIALARTIKNGGGLKRQRQYIGKLLRNTDAEPIQQALNDVLQPGVKANAKFHRLEHWRDRLIEEGQAALEELMHEYPHAERQRLRQLLSNIKKETAQNKPPKSARSLFKYLREIMEHSQAQAQTPPQD